jgi:hypothetical protein
MFEGLEKSVRGAGPAGPHPRLIRLAREVGAFPAEAPDEDAKLEHTQPGLYVRGPGLLARLARALKALLRPTASA